MLAVLITVSGAVSSATVRMAVVAVGSSIPSVQSATPPN